MCNVHHGVKGGQGRTAEEVCDAGFWALVAGAFMVVAMILALLLLGASS